MIWTVFFDNESDEMPQDFPTKKEAEEYAEERIAWGVADSFTISCTDGECLY